MILAIYIIEAIDTTISLQRLWLLSSHSYYDDHSREGFDKMNRGALAAMIDRKLLLSLILSRLSSRDFETSKPLRRTPSTSFNTKFLSVIG